MKVWKLLTVFSSCVPPSETLIDPLLNFLMTTAEETDDEEIRGFAKMAFMRVCRSYEDELRKEITGIVEMKYVEERK